MALKLNTEPIKFDLLRHWANQTAEEAEQRLSKMAERFPEAVRKAYVKGLRDGYLDAVNTLRLHDKIAVRYD